MKSQAFSIKKRIKSFKYALEGLKTLLIQEHNARIHLAATFIAIGTGIFFKISYSEWGMIVFAIVLVFVTEIINTAIEDI